MSEQEQEQQATPTEQPTEQPDEQPTEQAGASTVTDLPEGAEVDPLTDKQPVPVEEAQPSDE